MLNNLRSDPFEQAHEIGIGYNKWRIDRAFMLVPAQQVVGEFLATFREYPPSQKVGSFSLDKVMAMLASGSGQVAPAEVQAKAAASAPQKEPEAVK
jgi:arylsulfatase